MGKLTEQMIVKASEKFGTPFFFYDARVLRTTYQSLRAALPKQVDIFYSMKANPLLGICQLLQQAGSCCEVCSEAELEVAFKAGFDPKNIIFVGPGKSSEELTKCMNHQIYAVVVESVGELHQINQLAKRQKLVCPILLRINPRFMVKNAPLKMGGKPTQFGIDMSVIESEDFDPTQFENLKVLGIHVYNGTRILDAKTVVENTSNIMTLAEELSQKWKIEFESVDIGGGLGIPYFLGEEVLDLNSFAAGMKLALSPYLKKNPNTRVVLESGRFLVGNSGSLISKVLSEKSSYGENFLVTDGGTNCHMAATGIGSFMKRNFPTAVIATDKNNNTLEKYNITGPLCTPGDVIARQVELPKLKPGDLIQIKASGAYGPTASPGRFLSHGFPAEVLLDEEELFLLRRRETAEDILSTQYSLANDFKNPKEKCYEQCQ